MNNWNVDHERENVNHESMDYRQRVVDAIEHFLIENADRVAVKLAQRRLMRKRSRMRRAPIRRGSA